MDHKETSDNAGHFNMHNVLEIRASLKFTYTSIAVLDLECTRTANTRSLTKVHCATNEVGFTSSGLTAVRGAMPAGSDERQAGYAVRSAPPRKRKGAERHRVTPPSQCQTPVALHRAQG